MKLRHLSSLLIIVLAFPMISFFGASIAKADEFTVIPPKFELFGNPGDILTEQIKIHNESTEDISFQTEVDNFQAVGDDGSVGLVSGNSSNYALASWVVVTPTAFVAPAGEDKVITLNIKIPTTAEPGGHYATILVHRAGQTSPGGASVASQVGTLLLLSVSGNVTEKLSLDSFNTTSNYQQTGPVNFNLHFTNSGDVHVAPTGTIVITNTFGTKVDEIPVTPQNVLPGASRLLTASWDVKNLFGRYTATYVATYGSTTKQALTATTTFIVFPIYLLVLIIVVILLIYLLIKNRKKFKKLLNKLTSD